MFWRTRTEPGVTRPATGPEGQVYASIETQYVGRTFRSAVAAFLALTVVLAPAVRAARSLPDHLSDAEFWRMVTEFSEPDGYFQSDNLVSNERQFQRVVPALQRLRGHGAYLGVAPDQNFTFIAALEPEMAFIVDIRRGNLHAHLMYKALFELSADRADFLSRLFARVRPAGLGAMSGVQEILAALENVPRNVEVYDRNLAAIEDRLVETHGFALSEEDRRGIAYIYGMFANFGPAITYQSSNTTGRRFRFGNMPSFAELHSGGDGHGQNHSYLANEENFRAVKALETRNLIVPVVGDFAGPKALRAVGGYLGEHDATVAAFYVSNVEQYLFQNGIWRAFYDNVARLPLNERSVFVRSISGLEVTDPILRLLRDVAGGQVASYPDLRGRGRGPDGL